MFRDRTDAGEQLAEKLKYKFEKDGLVLAIPRGGVALGRVVADNLNLPLDVLVVSKIGAPGEEELALGAVGPRLGGHPVVIWEEGLCRMVGVSANWKKNIADKKSRETDLKARLYRSNREVLEVNGKTVILVDDGMATGATVRVAVKWLRGSGAGKIVLAIPVAERKVWKRIAKTVDKAEVLVLPVDFRAVGQFYSEFGPVTDEEVMRLL